MHLRFDAAVEHPPWRAGGSQTPRLTEALADVEEPWHRERLDPKSRSPERRPTDSGAGSFRDFGHEGGEDGIEVVHHAEAFGSVLLFTPREGEGGSAGNRGAQDQVARPESRNRPIGETHDFQCAILGPFLGRDLTHMVGTTKERPLPFVARSARNGGAAPARSTCFELIPVAAIPQHPLHDGDRCHPTSIGMKVHDHSRMLPQGTERYVERGVGTSVLPKDLPQSFASSTLVSIGHLVRVLQRSTLGRGESSHNLWSIGHARSLPKLSLPQCCRSHAVFVRLRTFIQLALPVLRQPYCVTPATWIFDHMSQ
ncbi:MAG: hypothetical protein LZF60_110044 [Nitrospira sp.]|nr:MAG: hypothetical protein LZF60_110044 [Nitrospira sp.]